MKYNTQEISKAAVIVLAVIIIIGCAAIIGKLFNGFVPQNQPSDIYGYNNGPVPTNTNGQVVHKPSAAPVENLHGYGNGPGAPNDPAPFDNGSCGFTVQSVAPNGLVNLPLTIIGVVQNAGAAAGCQWQMFEGQAGSAVLSYRDQYGWHVLGPAVAIDVADWMSPKTAFSVKFDLQNTLKSGTELKVLFTEENASGMPPVDQYELPLRIR
jgi:hypothetical protein